MNLLALLNTVAASDNLLLGFMPESVSVFVIGVILIISTLALRWVLKERENGNSADGIHDSI